MTSCVRICAILCLGYIQDNRGAAKGPPISVHTCGFVDGDKLFGHSPTLPRLHDSHYVTAAIKCLLLNLNTVTCRGNHGHTAYSNTVTLHCVISKRRDLAAQQTLLQIVLAS